MEVEFAEMTILTETIIFSKPKILTRHFIAKWGTIMKSKLLLLLILGSAYLSTCAQGLNKGDAVTTESGGPLGGRVVKIFPVGNPSTSSPAAAYGDNWGLADPPYSAWDLQTLGQVFGLAINTNSANHVIYTSTTQVYARVQPSSYYSNGYASFPEPMDSGATMIWALDPVTGTASSLVVSTTDFPLATSTGNAIFNRGTTIGNICFNSTDNMIYATNMEDGMIYRIDGDPSHVGTYGNVLDRYDPFLAFPYLATPNDTPVFAKRGDRLWGIAYSHGRLYYALWNEDMGDRSASLVNGVYSIPILPGGGFNALPSGSLTNTFVDPIPHHEFDMPPFEPGIYSPAFSNPVSDIEISLDGYTMFVAERTMQDSYNNGSGAISDWAHKARVLRYDLAGSWSPSSNQYFVGNASDYNNSAGGVDLGYSDTGYQYGDTLNPTDTCERILWATGDALKYHYGFGTGLDDPNHVQEFVYGIAGMPIYGNDLFDVIPPYDPYAVNYSSLYQDIFNTAGSGGMSKSKVGDVDVYREPCACHVTATLTVTPDTPCVGQPVVLHSSGGHWGKYYIDNGADESGIKPEPIGGSIDTLPPVDATPGVHTVCYVAYSDNPDSSVGWCSDTVCVTFEIRTCICDVHATFTASADTVCIGDTLYLYTGGGTWGRYILDGSSHVSPYVPMPMSGRIDSLEIGDEDSVVGPHTLCFVAYSANPDSAGDTWWCSDTICITIVVRNCCVRPDAFFTINGDSLGNDTICYGQVVALYATGGTWGKYYIDNGLDSSNIMDVPVGGRFDTLPPFLATVGTHTLCWVAFTANPDSTPNWCSDTMCLTFTVKQCCDSLHAGLVFPDSICAGSVYLIKVSGGAYGQLILDDTMSITGIVPAADFPPGGIPTSHIEDSLIGTTHKLCYVAYSDTTPGACTDTVCKYVKVVRCNCDSNFIAIANTPTGPMSYAFSNVGDQIPDFVQWSVDGVYQTQTNGMDPFNYTFPTGGFHEVCLHAGYLQPTTDGHAICCYKDRCDTIDIDRCDIWRATDSITYTYDSLDYHTIHFTYTGLTPTSIIWDFGGGDVDYSSNSPTVTHTFNDGFQHACIYVVWSLHDSANCCCLDTICVNFNINPCSVTTFDISTTPVVPGEYVFQVTHTAGFVTFGPIQWVVNTVTQPGTGVILDYVVPSNGIYDICADFNYNISTDGGSFQCHAKWCIQDTLTAAGAPAGRFRAYPNPTSGAVVVEITNYGDGGKTAKVDVVDVTGQVVMSKAINDIPKGISQNYMNVSQLPLGVYSLRMSMDDAHEISKLVKK
ncbi:MAG: hypothetical protein JWO03_3103 [Bacteroidetes bacterium]|nr:hypothetical protein [Bacteroidota bacterium]